MLTLVRDPEIINGFANHPEILPAIGGKAFDFGPAMLETTVYLFGEHGGFCFEWTAPETFEVHVMLTKEGRGPWGFAAALEARDMIERMGGRRLWARIDPASRHLAFFTRRAGFREVGSRTLYIAGEPALYRIFEWRSECPQ